MRRWGRTALSGGWDLICWKSWRIRKAWRGCPEEAEEKRSMGTFEITCSFWTNSFSFILLRTRFSHVEPVIALKKFCVCAIDSDAFKRSAGLKVLIDQWRNAATWHYYEGNKELTWKNRNYCDGRLSGKVFFSSGKHKRREKESASFDREVILIFRLTCISLM